MLVNKKIKKTELQSLLNDFSGKGYTFMKELKKVFMVHNSIESFQLEIMISVMNFQSLQILFTLI